MLDDDMSNLQPQDLRSADPHRALWACQTCGRQFTSTVRRVTDQREVLCGSCKQKRYMKNLKERNDKIRADIREQERKQREAHKKSKEHKK